MLLCLIFNNTLLMMQIMKLLSYIIIAALLVRCGEHRDSGDAQHIFDASDQGDDKTRAIFSVKQTNDQYCFYEGKVSKDRIDSEAWDNKNLQTFAQDIELLTPRSLRRTDVSYAVLMEDKIANVMSHLLVNPATVPVALTCRISAVVFLVGNAAAAIVSGPGAALTMVTLGKVAAASCGFELAMHAGKWGTAAYYILFGKSELDVLDITSNRMLPTVPESFVRLRKTFTWLESRDAVQCPAKLQFPTQTETTSTQQTHKGKN